MKTIWESQDTLWEIKEDQEDDSLTISDNLIEVAMNFDRQELAEILPVLEHWLSKRQSTNLPLDHVSTGDTCKICSNPMPTIYRGITTWCATCRMNAFFEQKGA